MTLTTKQKHYLKVKSHPLKPIITIGNHGLTDSVLAEFSLALAHHELIKVKINGADRLARKQMAETIANQTHSQIIQSIGRMSTFFRQSEKIRIDLSKIH